MSTNQCEILNYTLYKYTFRKSCSVGISERDFIIYNIKGREGVNSVMNWIFARPGVRFNILILAAKIKMLLTTLTKK